MVMDLQSYFRLMNVFPGAGINDPSGGTGIGPGMQPDNTPPDDTGNNLMGSYQPRTAISSELTDTLGAMPVRPDPSRLRRIGAGIAAFGAGSNAQGIVGGQPIGFKFDPKAADLAGDQVKYGDYNDKLKDWDNQVKALTVGANEEDRYNTNERQRVSGNEDRQIKQQRADAYDEGMRIKEQAETDKHEYAMQKLTDHVAEADAKLALAKRKLDQGDTSIEALKKYHQAQIAAMQARHELQTKDLEFKHEQGTRMNDARIHRMEMLNQNMPGQDKETTQTVYDDKSNVIQSKTTRSGRPQPNNILTDYSTNPPSHYDTSTWSATDIASAKARGWK